MLEGGSLLTQILRSMVFLSPEIPLRRGPSVQNLDGFCPTETSFGDIFENIFEK